MRKSSIKEHVNRWTKAWNDHDLKGDYFLYAKNIEFSSPKLDLLMTEMRIASHSESTITNKRDLQKYFSIGLAKFPNLRFTPLTYLTKGNVPLSEYICEPIEIIKWHVIEKFEFEGGLVVRSSVFSGSEKTKL